MADEKSRVVIPEVLPAEAPVVGELIGASGGSMTSAAGLAGERAAAGRRSHQDRREKHAAIVQKYDEKIRLGAARVALQAMDAAQVLRPDEDETGMGSRKPEGWTQRHYQIALDARLADKDAPAYIRHCFATLRDYRKAEALEADSRPSPTLNCDIQVVMKSEITYKYEVLEAKEE